MIPTKANQINAIHAPIIGAIVADLTVGVYLVKSAIPSTQAKLNAAIMSIPFPVGSIDSVCVCQFAIAVNEFVSKTTNIIQTHKNSFKITPTLSTILIEFLPNETAPKSRIVIKPIPNNMGPELPGSPYAGKPNKSARRKLIEMTAIKVFTTAQPKNTIVLSTVGKILPLDRKSTRLNSSHVAISYAVFCLKKKKQRE